MVTCFGRRMGKGMPASGPPRALALASPRRRPLSENLHFGGICGISLLFGSTDMFSRKGSKARASC